VARSKFAVCVDGRQPYTNTQKETDLKLAAPVAKEADMRVRALQSTGGSGHSRSASTAQLRQAADVAQVRGRTAGERDVECQRHAFV
jgi:hypothetical protein